jgi:hypothetical protein
MGVPVSEALEQALNNAEGNTEREIFGEATGAGEPDESGDRSLETMGDGPEGDHLPESTRTRGRTPARARKKGDKAEDKDRDEQGRFKAEDKPERKGDPAVPLKAEREARRAAEAERDAERARYNELKAEIEALKQQRAQPKQEQQTEDKPDFFADPEGFLARRDAAILAQVHRDRVEASFESARDEHKETFDAAFKTLVEHGQAEAQSNPQRVSPTVQRIQASRNPGRAVVEWYRQQTTLREVGNDPEAWLNSRLEKMLDDPAFQAKVIERTRGKASGANGERPNTVTRIPRSLNSAAGGSAREADPELYNDSDHSVFAHATRG